MADSSSNENTQNAGGPTDGALWVVRTGRDGEYAEAFWEGSFVALAVAFPRDARTSSTRDIAEALASGEAVWSGRATSFAGMLKRFVPDVAVGDVVISPEPARRQIMVGLVAADYRFVPGGDAAALRHRHAVRWLGTIGFDDLPRNLRGAIGSPMAFFRPGAERPLKTFVRSRVAGA